MKKQKKIIIIAGGKLNDIYYHQTLITNDHYIICANGGTLHALAMDLRPDLIIGDLDSLPVEILAELESMQTEIKQFPPTKDKSDLELAIDCAVEMHPEDIIIMGALGGKRVDHLYANILLLNVAGRKNIPASIIDENHHIKITAAYMKIEGLPGDYLSLFPVTADGAIVTTTNLKYQLNREQLNFASSRGLSNEMLGKSAEIKVESGLLLVIRSKKDIISNE